MSDISVEPNIDKLTAESHYELKHNIFLTTTLSVLSLKHHLKPLEQIFTNYFSEIFNWKGQHEIAC